VLVVEDNADMRRDLLEVLARHYTCLAVGDGEAAVEMAVREVPDLVVCDVMLPGRDGLSVCRALKSDERTCHIPVLMLTALGDREHRLSGLVEQADDYLAKPFGEDELLLRLRNLLDLRRLLQRRHARDLRFERRQPAGLGERDREFLSKLGGVLDARHAEHGFDPVALASALAVSERQLQRKLRALTGLAPGELLRDYRLQRAYERLAAGDRAGVVAAGSGFASHSHFAACFRARFGHAPGETRVRARRPA
jgi:CheY-like chemotaxis protein